MHRIYAQQVTLAYHAPLEHCGTRKLFDRPASPKRRGTRKLLDHPASPKHREAWKAPDHHDCEARKSHSYGALRKVDARTIRAKTWQK